MVAVLTNISYAYLVYFNTAETATDYFGREHKTICESGESNKLFALKGNIIHSLLDAKWWKNASTEE